MIDLEILTAMLKEMGYLDKGDEIDLEAQIKPTEDNQEQEAKTKDYGIKNYDSCEFSSLRTTMKLAFLIFPSFWLMWNNGRQYPY